jgi:hypothetical protein
LAQLLDEERVPPDGFWDSDLKSSRLLEYEVMNRVFAHDLVASHGRTAQHLIGAVDMLALAPPILVRALMPFPIPVRTLDALHLATMHYLRGAGALVQLASFDRRLIAAAAASGFAALPI